MGRVDEMTGLNKNRVLFVRAAGPWSSSWNVKDCENEELSSSPEESPPPPTRRYVRDTTLVTGSLIQHPSSYFLSRTSFAIKFLVSLFL